MLVYLECVIEMIQGKVDDILKMIMQLSYRRLKGCICWLLLMSVLFPEGIL